MKTKAKQLALNLDAAHSLTERQSFALEAVKIAGSEGIKPDEIGALLHTRKTFHGHRMDERCAWCKGDGLAMLRRLRELERVRYLGKRKVWVAVGAPEEKPRGMSDEIPY